MNRSDDPRRGILLFDFDGTIADSMTVAMEVFREVAPKLGIDPIATNDARLRRMNPREALAASGIPLWKVPLLIAAIRFRLRDRMTTIEPFPGVPEAIESLVREGRRCAIVSSNARGNIERFLRRHPIEGLEILVTGAGLFGKTRALRRALARSGVTPGEAVYVGDELRDVEAARAVGMRSVAVEWGYADGEALRAARPDRSVADPDALVRALRER